MDKVIYAPYRKQAPCSIGRSVVTKILSALKSKEFLPLPTTEMNTEDMLMIKISQTEQEYNIMSLICVLKNNELINIRE